MASVLFVCTGNICRSPIAEGLLRALLAGRSQEVEVRSAGIVGWEGSPAVDEAVRAAADLGVDISGHRARRLERRHVEGADLVLCMAAEHRDAIVQLVPEAEGRTFGLKELVRLLERLPPARRTGSVAEVARAADELRRSGSPVSPANEDDVADPIGMSPEAFRSVAADIEAWSGRLVAALFRTDADGARQTATA